jgi:hypothetical protein
LQKKPAERERNKTKYMKFAFIGKEIKSVFKVFKHTTIKSITNQHFNGKTT